MGTQSADAEVAASHELNTSPTDPSQAFRAEFDVDPKGSATRAIVMAMLISSPFWALVAFTIYLIL